MVDIFASGSALTAAIGRFGYSKCMMATEPKSVRVHPMQALAICQLYTTVVRRTSLFWRLIERIKMLFIKNPHQMTFMGLPVVETSEMPEDQLQFLDEQGEVIGMIRNLAIPWSYAR
jgi:hypothetical protein